MEQPTNLQKNVLLANHTTFRIGGPARYFCVVKKKEELLTALRWGKANDLPIFVLGGGSNLLVSDAGFDGLVIKCQMSDFQTQLDGEKFKVICGAGVLFNKIILETAKNGYSGVEWGFGIPGTIGGAICGNAGRLGEDVSQVVESVEVLDDNFEVKVLPKDECKFDYRESRFKHTSEIILLATLNFIKKDQAAIDEVLFQAKDVIKKSPPFPSAGCAFKNYKLKSEEDELLKNHSELASRVRGGKIGVGFLLEQCGLGGRQVGGAKVWEGHKNYIVNVGGAKASEIKELIKICQAAVKEKYGIDLVEEIRYL